MRSRWTKKKIFFGIIVLLLIVLFFTSFSFNVKVRGVVPTSFSSRRIVPIKTSAATVDNTSTVTVSSVNNQTSGVLSSADLKLYKAAYKIRKSPVSASYLFASDVYFHPQLTGDENSIASSLPGFLHSPAVCSGSGPQSSSSDQQIADQDVFLVVTVLSSYLPKATKERQAIRNSYGSVVRQDAATRSAVWPGLKSLSARVALVFLLGRPPSDTYRQMVETEAKQFGDLVVADFVDSYKNLSIKVLVGLHWTVTNCPTARYILKADDDTFVHLPLLANFLLHRGQNNSVYGTVYPATSVSRRGRWKVSSKDFPFPKYPAYVSGTAYALSTDAAKKILEASTVVPRIPVEDAYITGILVQVAHIQLFSCSGFTIHTEGRTRPYKFMVDQKMISNKMTASDKDHMWTVLKIGDPHSHK